MIMIGALDPAMSRPTRFTIRSVCALTGVNPNTLRAWERRYGLVTPERTASGYRLYTMQDVERLRAIQDLLNAGVPAGQVAKHLPPAGAPDAASRAPDQASVAPTTRTSIRSTPQTVEEFASAVMDAALAGDDARTDRLFSRAVGLFSVASAFNHVLLAAGRSLYQREQEGDTRANEARLRIMTFARQRLAKLLAGLKPLHQRPLVVVMNAGPPCPHLEGDLMQVALELGMARVSTSYVVASDGPEPLTEALDTGSVRAVVMACGSCETGTPAWQKAVERLRGVRVHVMANDKAANCDWVRSVGAGILPGASAESTHTLLQSLGRA
jgi:DNA-binding transcriptional MerR regulator